MNGHVGPRIKNVNREGWNTLEELRKLALAQGCTQAQLYAGIDKRKTLLLIEEWESREQFERNLDTAKLNTIVAVIELSSEAPVVRIDSVEREEGVETLALHRPSTGAVRHWPDISKQS